MFLIATRPEPRRRRRGFTVIELIVTLTLIALLAQLAVNGLSSWVSSARLRMTADYIENGLRLAQVESMKQNRVVAFVLTTSLANASTMPAAATGGSGSYWYAATVPWTSYTAAGIGNTKTLVAAGEVSKDAAFVTVTGPTTICFTPFGRPTATYVDPTGFFTCASTSANFSIAPSSGSDASHNLEVSVTSGGRIRMCNPNKSISSYPDGANADGSC